nr:hypothetical protein [uncultured Ruminococcus sp.]
MKRTVSIICAVLMLIIVLCLTACSGGSKLDGSYKLVEMSSGGQDMTSYLNMIGDVYLVIEGEKATIELGGETTQLKVDAKNSAFIDEAGDSTPITIEGDRITMENPESQSKMVFEKTTATADSK